MLWKFIFWPVVWLSVFIPGWIYSYNLSGVVKIISFFIGFILFLYSISLISIAGRTLKKYAHKNGSTTFWPDKFTPLGLYKCMRHPMHFGLALLPVSIALMWGSVPVMLSAGWGVAAAFWFVLMIEEPETIAKFEDEYLRYMQEVPAFSINPLCIDEGLKVLEISNIDKPMTQEESKVEVRGFEAKYYDTLMNIITFGWYPSFIKRVIADLRLENGDKVIDFGAGTGRNALLMRKYVGDSGQITGVEIGKEMKEQFISKTSSYSNIKLLEQSIEEPFEEKEKYDVVFISFVLHGFIQPKRNQIIDNAYSLLKEGGIFAILDYNEFDVSEAPFYIRFPIRKMECPLAEDFINRDLKTMLEKRGFNEFLKNEYFNGYLRLMIARK